MPEAATISAVNARIGPNALIQTVRALRDHYAEDNLYAILNTHDQTYLLEREPTEMVMEQEFSELVDSLCCHLDNNTAHNILKVSGQYTADYLLAHRIPGFFQKLLKILPKRLALRALLTAIGMHAWTFAGSGTFTYTVGQRSELVVTSPIQPGETVSGFYGGTFEHLIHTLIDSDAQIDMTLSHSSGTTRCTYTVLFS